MKAFIVNRVGDFVFALGIFGLFYLSGSVVFGGEAGLFAFFEQYNPAKDAGLFGFSGQTTLNILLFLLFMGAMGKSAQLFLHTWLPDAMEGPTPVSALIHAATMVTAGVFMVARLSPVFELAPLVLNFITIIGAWALFAATVGLTQFDIGRVIAYSTCSQLGYMFFAGVLGHGRHFRDDPRKLQGAVVLGAGSVIRDAPRTRHAQNGWHLARPLPMPISDRDFSYWALVCRLVSVLTVVLALLGSIARMRSRGGQGSGYVRW